MPIDKDRLAYASNHDGRGDLNSLAHTLVVHVKAGRLPKEAIALFCGTYNGICRSKPGFQPLITEEDLLKKLNRLAPDQVEKEMTPVLEALLPTDPKKKRLNRFIELANSLGMKVEVYGAECTEDDETVLQRYVDFIPSKKLELTKVETLAEEIEEAEDGTELADITGSWEDAVEQDKIGDESPKVKLFLKSSSGDSCDYYFEYPCSELPEEDEEDEEELGLGLMFDREGPAERNTAKREREKLRYEDHNEVIHEENEKVKRETLDDDQPYSLGKAFSVLFSGFFGGGFTKLLESIMSAFSPLTQGLGPLASAFGGSGFGGDIGSKVGSARSMVEVEEDEEAVVAPKKQKSGSESSSDSSFEDTEGYSPTEPSFDMFFSDKGKRAGIAPRTKLKDGYEKIPEIPIGRLRRRKYIN